MIRCGFCWVICVFLVGGFGFGGVDAWFGRYWTLVGYGCGGIDWFGFPECFGLGVI